jgi:hypothetical protein
MAAVAIARRSFFFFFFFFFLFFFREQRQARCSRGMIYLDEDASLNRTALTWALLKHPSRRGGRPASRSPLFRSRRSLSAWRSTPRSMRASDHVVFELWFNAKRG